MIGILHIMNSRNEKKGTMSEENLLFEHDFVFTPHATKISMA